MKKKSCLKDTNILLLPDGRRLGTPNTVTPTASSSSSFTAIPIPDFCMDSCLPFRPGIHLITPDRPATASQISIRLVAVSRTGLLEGGFMLVQQNKKHMLLNS